MFRIAIIVVLLILLWAQTTNPARANDFDLTIGGGTDGGDLDIVQDGEDNNIDFDIISMDIIVILNVYANDGCDIYVY